MIGMEYFDDLIGGLKLPGGVTTQLERLRLIVDYNECWLFILQEFDVIGVKNAFKKFYFTLELRQTCQMIVNDADGQIEGRVVNKQRT